MERVKQGLLFVKYTDGNYRWFRISRRTVKNIEEYFGTLNNFRYAKCYEFTRGRKKGTGTPGAQIGFFGVNTKTGEIYSSWN